MKEKKRIEKENKRKGGRVEAISQTSHLVARLVS
jgi:hypothetical protein